MSPSRDYRAGPKIVRIKPMWSGQYCCLEEASKNGYRNFPAYNNLPANVQAAIDVDGAAYWHIMTGDGAIKYVKEASQQEWSQEIDMANETTVFDELGNPQWQLLVDRLIDKCELDLRNPDLYKFNGLNDEQWEEVKRRAHEQINGRG